MSVRALRLVPDLGPDVTVVTPLIIARNLYSQRDLEVHGVRVARMFIRGIYDTSGGVWTVTMYGYAGKTASRRTIGCILLPPSAQPNRQIPVDVAHRWLLAECRRLNLRLAIFRDLSGIYTPHDDKGRATAIAMLRKGLAPR